MSPAEARLAATGAALRRDWGEVQRQLARARSMDPHADAAAAAYVALALDHAYQALEQVLVAIERGLGLPARAGERWHRAALADACRPIPGLRPALLPPEAELDWAELLSFRHFLRHAYAADLDPERLRRNVDRLQRAVALTDPVLSVTLAALVPTEAGGA